MYFNNRDDNIAYDRYIKLKNRQLEHNRNVKISNAIFWGCIGTSTIIFDIICPIIIWCAVIFYIIRVVNEYSAPIEERDALLSKLKKKYGNQIK